MSEHAGGMPRSLEVEVANQMGQIRAQLEAIVERNPPAPAVMRAALVRVIGRCAPLCDASYVQMLAEAHRGMDREDQ